MACGRNQRRLRRRQEEDQDTTDTADGPRLCSLVAEMKVETAATALLLVLFSAVADAGHVRTKRQCKCVRSLFLTVVVCHWGEEVRVQLLIALLTPPDKERFHVGAAFIFIQDSQNFN